MANDVRVIGLEDLGRSIEQLTQNVQRKVVRNATRAGARVYRDGMKQRVKKLSGELEKNIAIKDHSTRDGGYVALVGVRYKHKVAASARKRLKGGGLAEPSTEDPAIYALWLEGVISRPGASGHTHQNPQPFVRPTFDSDTAKAEDAFADRARLDIEADLRK